MSRFQVGDVVYATIARVDSQERPSTLIPGPTPYLVVEVEGYEASAHNDRWQDFKTTFLRINETTFTISTEDAFDKNLFADPEQKYEIEPVIRYDYRLKAPTGRHSARAGVFG
jgi:hypothetical protein